jgi:ActR/RegA family two-component response regulator
MPSTTTEFIVFLIDDDPAILKALGRFLRAAGYQTKAYQSAEAFLNEHDASIPGCAVLDHAMRGLNGSDVQEALARQGMHRPVIFLTGRGTIAESVKAMRAGAVDYLTKPVDKGELLSAIRSAEERDKTQRDVEARSAIVGGKARPGKKWNRPADTHADPTGDCDRTCAVRAFVEHGIYRRPLRHAVYRAVDFSRCADGFRRGHHGRNRAPRRCAAA